MSYEDKRNAHYESWLDEQEKCVCDDPKPYLTNTHYCKQCDKLITYD